MTAVDDLITKLPDDEVDEFLATILTEYGQDYRGYQRVFIRRRLRAILAKTGVTDLTELNSAIATRPELRGVITSAISISVTEMFRDPEVFLTLRREVMGVLGTYPFVRIWVAGCATGEEAYSLAIMLQEEGFDGRYQIYATDISEPSLERARDGLLPMKSMKANTRNYQLAGGKSDFSNYYTAHHGLAKVNSQLRKQILFSQHDLAGSMRFNEFQLIMCRNVMIYFDGALRNRVHELLYNSLVNLGFLVLGQKETVRFSAREDDYQTIHALHKIYKKKH